MPCRSPTELAKGSPSRGNEVTSVLGREENEFQSSESRNGAWDSRMRSPVRAVSGKEEADGKGATVLAESDDEKANG